MPQRKKTGDSMPSTARADRRRSVLEALEAILASDLAQLSDQRLAALAGCSTSIIKQWRVSKLDQFGTTPMEPAMANRRTSRRQAETLGDKSEASQSLPNAMAERPQRRGAKSLVDMSASSGTVGSPPARAGDRVSRRRPTKAVVKSEAKRLRPKAIDTQPQRRAPKSRVDTSRSSGTGLPTPNRAGAELFRRQEATRPPVELTTDEICLRLMDLQRKRIFCIVSQSRADRAMQSAIAKCIGYDPAADEAGRKAVFKAAGTIIKAVEANKSFDVPVHADNQDSLDSFLPLIPVSAQSRAVWDQVREKTENEMRKLARSLSVFVWVSQNAKGVGDLGLARLVAEATSLRRMDDGSSLLRTISAIETHEKLWKRMGVAVVGAERQQKKSDKIDALLHGYAPRRRAELWSVCSDTMFRQQWRKAGEEDEGPGYPVGPYGEVYRVRKAVGLERVDSTEALPFTDKHKWTRKRADADARRVMSKEFLRDLWRVWHGMEARHPARFVQAAATSVAA